MLSALVGCATGGGHREPVVKKLTIVGNRALSDRQIGKKILTSPTAWWPFAKTYSFDPVVWATDLERIKRLYGSHGYYQAEIVRDRVTPRPPHGVELEVDLREGAPTHVTSFEVMGLEGFPPATSAAMLAALPLHVGDVFDEGKWAAAKAQLQGRLRDRGYAEVAVEGLALVDV
jgi:translocation and assembly module TamA